MIPNLKPTPIEKHIGPNFPLGDYKPTTKDEKVSTANTNLEIRWAERENKGFKTFSFSWLLDGLRGTKKNFGEYDGENKKEDERKQLEAGVSTFNNTVENPMGDNLKGETHIMFASDFHLSKKPLESNRTYTVKSIGYRIIRFFEKGVYNISEFFNGNELREEGTVKLLELLPRVMSVDKEKLGELGKTVEAEMSDDEKLYKWVWNRALLFRAKMSNADNVENLKKIVDEEFNNLTKNEAQKTTIPKEQFKEQELWKIRNGLIQTLLPMLFKNTAESIPEDANTLFMTGGDEAHDGGVIKDHLTAREIIYGILGKTKGKSKFIGELGGNHDQDPREPRALLEVFRMHGHRIFHQEVHPEEEGGKKNLVVGLNTFVMAPEWDEVLDKYLQKNEHGLTDEELQELKEWRDKINTAQEETIKKMAEFEGNCIILHAHNSRRLLDYMQRNEIKFKKGVQVKIISGHTHEDDNYRALVDKPTEGDKKEHMEIYKSSAIIKVGNNSIRIPKGLKTVIDKNGNVKIYNVDFTDEQRQKIQSAFRQTEIK